MKTHFRDVVTDREEYKDRPHYFKAILDGHLTVCKRIRTKVTLNPLEVTCGDCKDYFRSFNVGPQEEQCK